MVIVATQDIDEDFVPEANKNLVRGTRGGRFHSDGGKRDVRDMVGRRLGEDR